MDALFAMTLPGLVVLLIVVGAIEVVLTRRRRARGDTTARPVVAATGFDVLGLALSPGHKHKLEHDEFQEVRRDDEGEGAPPYSTVDLDSGVARIVVPRQD
jgi:hypothetical protein